MAVKINEEDDTPMDLPITYPRTRFFTRNPPRAPSSEAAVETFRLAQDKDDKFIACGRPVRADKPLPASLMDPILCEFQYNLHDGQPEEDDIRIFRELRSCLTKIFQNEDARKSELITILNQLAPLGDLSCKAIGTYTTDGDLRIGVIDDKVAIFTRSSEHFLYYVQEVRNEGGTGGKVALVEGIHYYIEQVRRCHATIPEERQSEINFPAIILTHFGRSCNAHKSLSFLLSMQVRTSVFQPRSLRIDLLSKL